MTLGWATIKGTVEQITAPFGCMPLVSTTTGHARPSLDDCTRPARQVAIRKRLNPGIWVPVTRPLSHADWQSGAGAGAVCRASRKSTQLNSTHMDVPRWCEAQGAAEASPAPSNISTVGCRATQP